MLIRTSAFGKESSCKKEDSVIKEQFSNERPFRLHLLVPGKTGATNP
jgi:hypothetical protein